MIKTAAALFLVLAFTLQAQEKPLVFFAKFSPPGVVMQNRGALVVRAATADQALDLLADGARKMHANGILYPLSKQINGQIEIQATVVLFRHPEKLSGFDFMMR